MLIDGLKRRLVRKKEKILFWGDNGKRSFVSLDIFCGENGQGDCDSGDTSKNRRNKDVFTPNREKGHLFVVVLFWRKIPIYRSYFALLTQRSRKKDPEETSVFSIVKSPFLKPSIWFASSVLFQESPFYYILSTKSKRKTSIFGEIQHI